MPLFHTKKAHIGIHNNRNHSHMFAQKSSHSANSNELHALNLNRDNFFQLTFIYFFHLIS